MWDDFKRFMTSPNVLDWAVGVAIGTAFGKIIDSLVNDIITPPIGLLLGKVDFRDLFIDLTGGHYHSLPAAQAAGAATINYGTFINTVLNFILVSIIVFVLVRQLNRMVRPVPSPSETKPCPYCASEIPLQAVRCPCCTSNLETALLPESSHVRRREGPRVVVGREVSVSASHDCLRSSSVYRRSTTSK
ncbi:MAG: large conductance mechanosensitive channel protein MscL [Alicyclobacillus herbarius]|nr:large conductance mechanosensitive channel protein MscL [Alicyclobacillus herbarius]